MMLVVSPQDFQKLSPACRAELMGILTGASRPSGFDLLGEPADPETTVETEEVINDEKRVVDLTVSEANDLLANLGGRSSQTLRYFAAGVPVLLDTLVGEGKAYKDYIELKRSLVGAVNRRLRTVSGNRNAALFSSDRDKTRIKVTPKTAKSLRRVFEMPEPLPSLTYCDAKGEDLSPTNPKCIALEVRLSQVWSRYDSATVPENVLEFHSTVLKHLVVSGFELHLRTTVSWDQEQDIAIYEMQTVADPLLVIDNWRQAEHSDELFIGLPGEPAVLAQLANQ
jgi:hypothetical protein